MITCMSQAVSYKIIADDHKRCETFMENSTGRYLSKVATYVGLERNGVMVACVGYDSYKNNSIQMHLSKLHATRLTREFIWFIFYYPFNQIEVNCIVALVPKGSSAEIVALHAGFELRYGINESNMNLMILNRRNCRYL